MSRARVEASARLHLGLIDLRGELDRRFGGLGMALARPRVRLQIARADDDRAEGPDSERALRFARRFLEHHGVDERIEIEVEEAIPAHVGLGSGTQLALAVARAAAELFGLDRDPPALAGAVGRAERSSVGTWLFERGGFVVEGGRTPDSRAGPLLFHRALPEEWRCVIAIPAVERGMSGEAEAEAFRRLKPPAPERVGAISHLVLMGVLPALVERDLSAFGAAITEVQREVGDCFREQQGGRFAHPEVERLIDAFLRSGAPGAGQSSWGPAAFALAADDEQAVNLLGGARERVSPGGTAFLSRFENAGAICRLEDGGAGVPGGPERAGSG